jgi:hypothetical protein
MYSFGGSSGYFRRLGGTAGHPDLRGTVDDWRGSSCGTFGSDVKGSARVLRFELLG